MHKGKGKSSKSEAVRVVIRCRPMNKKEIEAGRQAVVRMDTKKGEIFIQKDQSEVPKIYTFDSVYDWKSEQEAIFVEQAFPIIENVLQGYNATLFAYGQTGTGKTHTMSGVPKDPELKGIMPRTFESIFGQISSDTTKQYLVRCSYLEIYNEEVRDLLSKNGQAKLDLKEKDGGVYVKDLAAFMVKTPEDLMSVFEEGCVNRHVGQTDMNDQSSRSHSIFTITVESSEIGVDGKPHIKAGKLNLVDLAGSERQSKTGATGDRLKEGTKINLSLSTLCHVISSLTDPKCTHVPYRDSKLTRLLQDSLGGNTKTVMIANIGPADYNMDETISTLRYANRAKHIENKPRINEDPKDAMIREFQDEIEKLKSELAAAAGGQPFDGNPGDPQIVEVEKVVHVENKEQMRELEERLAKEKKEMSKKFLKDKKAIEENVKIAEEEKERLLQELEEKDKVAQAAKQKQQKLLKKIKNMEEKLVEGNEAMEKAMKQEQELQRQRARIEEKRREQLRYEQELAEQNALKVDYSQKFASIKDEISTRKQQVEYIASHVQMIQSENQDIEEGIHREREDLMDRIRTLTREIRQKHLIIDHFIPQMDYQKIERRALWDQQKEEWYIPHVEYTGNAIKEQKAHAKKKKNGRPDSDYKNHVFENIMNMEDSEDENFEEAATKRVEEAISSILAEEED